MTLPPKIPADAMTRSYSSFLGSMSLKCAIPLLDSRELVDCLLFHTLVFNSVSGVRDTRSTTATISSFSGNCYVIIIVSENLSSDFEIFRFDHR